MTVCAGGVVCIKGIFLRSRLWAGQPELIIGL